ncbi:Ribosomal RNA small subunit methyltransferase G [Rosistilla oblonga]|uniref:Ribosomal RNA small subunit methyltransferase G n=3 Tax=Rosistilla TaxID=2795779 RepID=A0A518IRW9_9BACT|nr:MULTISPECIES: 16S rRNA (guanine(527)-N(7))-methyltransferase RsmG [Rosistilla]QDS87495.1 Ribosomal RNA small subunit methyltransferase G [Rosistilla ulvae]QDV11814.1 Ribosomal RNA small subunit methyltransferase G [Rosistilla oblonga]QDV55830.1 Ribosomal RNA small subunit methyltransferase G [Rosistilla oblonga]QDV68110.1 Ribosomal RNA small subunit methyltransferase G [Rosistilla carotiformis]
MTVEPEFLQALAQEKISLPDDQLEGLQDYARLMWEWNEKVNLTRHTTWQLFGTRDMLDVTQLANIIPDDHEVLDLGSGGGVPGIPLSIVRPDLQVSLAESVGKKAQVLNDIVSELNLPITVYAARAEDLLHDLRFDTIVVRAVGSLRKLCTWLEPHWASIGQVLAVKGPKWVEERNEARHHGVMKGLQLRKVASYQMPETENEGVILQIWKHGVPVVRK